MKFHSFKYLAFLLLAGGLQMQCTDLTEDTFTFISPETFYRNADDLDKALIGVYDRYQQHYGRDARGYFLKLECLSEFGAPNRTKDNPHLYNVWSDVNNPSNTIDKWQDSYEIINAANVVLGRGESIEMDATLKARMFAEARFLRGLTYFHLVRLYGDVPIPQSFTQGLDGLEIPRKPVDDVYEYLIADLHYAAENLPVRSTYAANDVWRASQGAAQAMLGKVYLYRGSMTGNRADFEESKKYSGMVIASSEYALEEDFKNLWFWWNTSAKNGVESIFEIQMAHIKNESNTLHIDGGINVVDENLGSYMYHRYGPSFTAYNSYSDQDARKEGTFLTEVALSNGNTIRWVEADKGTYPGSEGWNSACPGNLKYFDRTSESATIKEPAANIYVMRYAEVLLNYAEAENELNGPTADAYEKLNQVRTRAQLDDLESGLSQEEFAAWVYQERGWEFIGEGQLYYDGIRTGRIADGVKAEVEYGVANELFLYTPLQFVPKKDFLWKIPTFDLNSNAELIQNPDNQSAG
ncbi:RagB/SusD family nutrient uptake outer membrane protein [Catalinimonas alkaloidigena]|nr:RagB/SusD family nutrient uptake outer membrane protein [Catalinimonas alkaloidigena]